MSLCTHDRPEPGPLGAALLLIAIHLLALTAFTPLCTARLICQQKLGIAV